MTITLTVFYDLDVASYADFFSGGTRTSTSKAFNFIGTDNVHKLQFQTTGNWSYDLSVNDPGRQLAFGSVAADYLQFTGASGKLYAAALGPIDAYLFAFNSANIDTQTALSNLLGPGTTYQLYQTATVSSDYTRTLSTWHAGDSLVGNSLDNLLHAKHNGAHLLGNGGADTYFIDSGVTSVAQIAGGTGSDTIDFTTAGAVTIAATSGIDHLKFEAEAAPTFSLGASSALPSNLAIELVAPAASVSIIVKWMDAGAGTLDFGSWTVNAGAVTLTINGGGNDDHIVVPGDIHIKTLVDAGAGDDTVVAVTADATLHGGEGWDVLSYETYASGVVFLTSGDVTPSLTSPLSTKFDGFEVFRGGINGDAFYDDAEIGGVVFQGLGGPDSFTGTVTDEIDYSEDSGFGGTLGIVFNRTGAALTASSFSGDTRAALVAVLGSTDQVDDQRIRDTFGDIDYINSNLIISGSAHADFMAGGGDGETLFGNDGNDWLLGGGGADSLDGGEGSDVLGGGAGANTLVGGAANDTYLVDSSLDVIDESGGDGQDVVKSSVNFSLVTSATLLGVVEDLVLTGAAISATGNSGINHLTGNASANLLNGGAAADVMRGMAGNDTYVVDNAHDVVDEVVAGSSGIDLVKSSVTFTLGTNVENLTLTNTSSNTNGTGNTLNNVLDGSLTARANLLKGLTGNDTCILGAGDTADETGGTGIDTVRTAQTVSLVTGAANHLVRGIVEKLVLTGTGNFAGNGNDLANTLTGNTGKNALNGGKGNDVLNGGLGQDSLTGGANADTFQFTTAVGPTNVDRITDFSHADDTIQLGHLTMTALGNWTSAKFFAATTGHVATTVTQRIIYDKHDGSLWYDNDGRGSHAAIEIAILMNHPSNVDWTDFKIV